MSNMYGYNTSTARKPDIDSIGYGHNLQNELHKTSREVKESRQKVTRKNKLGSLIPVVLAFAAAFVIVNGHVSINEANNEIVKLKNEYNDTVATNQALQVKIDKIIDLNQLQTVAGERFGMVSPERYQMFYVDLEMGDMAESTGAGKNAGNNDKLAVTGTPGVITGTLNIFK